MKQRNIIKGKPLNFNAGIEKWYVKELVKLVDELTKEVLKEIKPLYKEYKDQITFTQDASITSQLRMKFNSLRDIFEKKFKDRGKTYAERMVRKTTLDEYLSHLEKLGYIKDKHYKYNKVDKVISFKNGSKIFFSSLDDSEKIKSLNLHWAEIEEASQIKENSFNQIIARVRKEINPKWKDFKYRVFGHTNPESTKGWIYKHFVEKKNENYRLIIAPTTQNTFLPKHFVEELKSAYDPEYYRINVLGEFGDYQSGLIVKNFIDKNIAELKYNKKLPLHLTCDFNVDPMCWEIAHKSDDKVFFIDELVIEKATTQQCVEEFLKRYPDHEGEIIINGDASGDNRSTQSEYTNYAIMRKAFKEYGIKRNKQNYSDVKFKIRDYNPPILNRIQAFNAKVKNAKNEINLYVDKKCKWLLYNIYNLSFKEGTTIVDIPTFNTIKKDRQSKFLMHPYDAASYLVEYYWKIK